MALPAIDTFTGTAGTLPDPPWTQQNTSSPFMERDGSGNATAGPAGADTFAFWNADVFDADQYSECVIGSGLNVNTDYIEVTVRAKETGASRDCYSFFTDGTGGAGHTGIQRILNGASTEILAISTTFAPGDVMRLEIIGDVLEAFKNGVSLGTVQDANLASGSAGIGIFNNGSAGPLIASWEGGNIGGAPANPDDFVKVLVKPWTAAP